MTETSGHIIWTKVDEAPQLASYSLLPIVEAFLAKANIKVETKDISLAGRILAQFPDRLTPEQKVPDYLTQLGELSDNPETNIIKLPNISASVPQLQAAIQELQTAGFNIPDYPDPGYEPVLGSAVNPVLRQGNSDRRAPASVKTYARKHPHKMGEWSLDNPCKVASMDRNDFYANEESIIMGKDDKLTIQLVCPNETITLADGVSVSAGEIVDATFMSVAELRNFYAEKIAEANKDNLLLSLHLKATMMKVSDPVMFGHGVEVFLAPVFEKYGKELAEAGVEAKNGIGAIETALTKLDESLAAEIHDAILACLDNRPKLAMVDSNKGITNLHAPNLVIIDASMPVVIRDSGQMWNRAGNLQPTLAMIPDRTYARVYQQVVNDCKINGKLDPATVGSVSNVGLMAQKAEEYGSHATTFVVPAKGQIQVLDSTGTKLFTQQVAQGDIWRMSRVKDIPVRDWVSLAVRRAKATGCPAVFFLDPTRAHDRNLITKVERYLNDENLAGVEIHLLDYQQATALCLERMRAGKDTISVTGNVLRDYLTDLFPILEIGTSAKMLSIVPLLAGGGLFETGAGGSAPKHVQQFLAENYLRWDSLGEFMALAASLEQVGEVFSNTKAQVLAKCLDLAVAQYLDENKSPARKLGELDNRGSHYWLATYWAQQLANQNQDRHLADQFGPIARKLKENEQQINQQMIQVQGNPVDLGGYYRMSDDLAGAAMRPSTIFNEIISEL